MKLPLGGFFCTKQVNFNTLINILLEKIMNNEFKASKPFWAFVK